MKTLNKTLSSLATLLVMVAMALVTVCSLTACGGDDEEETNVDGIPGNTHHKDVIKGDWYNSSNGNYYYFDGNGEGRYYYGPSFTDDRTCFLTYHVQGSGNWGTVYIKATYHSYTSRNTWRDEFSGSYNLQDGRLKIRDITYYKK